MSRPLTVDPRFLSYRDAARYLAVPIGTLRSWVSRKQIPHIRISARLVKFELAALEQWIDDRRVAP